MSTPNFSFSNTNNVYVIHEFEEFTLDFLRERAAEALKEKSGLVVSEINEHDDNRSYPAVFFTKIDSDFTYCGISVRVTAEIGLRSGYYGGCNLDFNLKVESGDVSIDPYYLWKNSRSYYEYDDPKDLADDFIEEVIDWGIPANVGYNKGLIRMNKGRFVKRLCVEIERMCEVADSLCKQLCDNEYACVGIFSNGEAIYEEV